MTLVFDHTTLGQRVLFGTGLAAEHLTTEVQRLGARRIMVLASPREMAEARAVTASLEVTVFHDEIAPHVPIENAETARRVAVDNAVDLLVSVGGGSTTGLAKAVALTTGLPIVAIPTTYAGSEATDVWGLTEASRKSTGVDPRVLPVTVIYDAQLTLMLPVSLSVAAGMNGIAHCIDSMWAPRTNPINQALAIEGIRTLAEGLPVIASDPQSLPAREQVLCGAYLAAVAFTSAGSGLHHKICHVLGGAYNLPHAETHATVLPYVLAFNATAAPDVEKRIAAALGSDSAVAGLLALRSALNAPRALKDYGFDEAKIAEAVELILPFIPASNPRAVTPEALENLLRAAYAGETPDL